MGVVSCMSYRGYPLGRAALALPVLLMLVALTGCGMPSKESPANSATSPMPILDPIAAFAADPPTNGEAMVVPSEGGESVRLRLTRQYAAASGRECREVRMTRRNAEDQRLYCRAGAGWIEARPLLSQPVGR